MVLSVGSIGHNFHVLTSKCFRSRQAGSRMRAHKTIYIDVVMLKLIQEGFCESTFSVVAIDYQLSNPTHMFVIDRPTAGECITSKMVVDSNPDIRAIGIIE